jgi:hypothetical protein
MSFSDYYCAAVARSFEAAVTWTLAQGIFLTVLFGGSALLAAIVYAGIRALGKQHSWGTAMNSIREALRDFALATIVVAAIAMAILFVIFFVHDAPKQLEVANTKIAELEATLKAKAIAPIAVDYETPMSGFFRPPSARRSSITWLYA